MHQVRGLSRRQTAEERAMPYAEGRIYNDADAHLMETAELLFSYADAKTRVLLKPLDLSKAGNWTCPGLMDTPKSAKVSAEGVNGGEGRKA
jgi:hypothetical protein